MTRLITKNDVAEALFTFKMLCLVSGTAAVPMCLDPAIRLTLWLMGVTEGFQLPTSLVFYVFVVLFLVILRMTVRQFHKWHNLQEQYDHQFKEIEKLEPHDFTD